MQIKITRREEVAEGTMTFFFEKPADFTFKAGQNGDFTLINPVETDGEGNTRTFSFVSAPSEKEIQIATRMRDTAFKRNLKTMPFGTTVELAGPMGSMTLHNDVTKPAAFLAGGIGITPFMSMLRDAAERKLPHRISLFYSNRRPEDAPFLSELDDLQGKNANFKFIGTMTNVKDSKLAWNGETGYIDGTMLKKYLGDLNSPIYYLAGPPAMTAAMRKTLNDAGVNDDYIRSEDFAGY